MCGDTALKNWGGIDDGNGQENILGFTDVEEIKLGGHGVFLDKGVMLEGDSGGGKDFSYGGAQYMEVWTHEL